MSLRVQPLGGAERTRSVPHTRLDDDAAVEKQYQKGEKLGAGSFGVVFTAIHGKTNKKWAMKIINKEKAGSSAVKLMEREITILKRVNHAHLVHLEEVFETPKRVYLVMELCDGGELNKLFMNEGIFSEADTRTIIQRLTSAVAYLHKNDIVHRDIKLENILLSTDPERPNDRFNIKLTDFGLSVVKGGVGSDSMLQNMCGTPMYMAPEVIDNQGYSQQCDIWSIGVIAFLLICGDPPFNGHDEDSLYDAIRKGDLDFSTNAWTRTSDEAKNAIQGLLKVDPAHRLTASELLDHPWITGDRSRPMNNGPTNVLEMMKQWKNDLMLEDKDDVNDDGGDENDGGRDGGEVGGTVDSMNNNVKKAEIRNERERNVSGGKSGGGVTGVKNTRNSSDPSSHSKTSSSHTGKKTQGVPRSKLSPTNGTPSRSSRGGPTPSSSNSKLSSARPARPNPSKTSPHRTTAAASSRTAVQERTKPSSPKGGAGGPTSRGVKKKPSGVS